MHATERAVSTSWDDTTVVSIDPIMGRYGSSSLPYRILPVGWVPAVRQTPSAEAMHSTGPMRNPNRPQGR